MPRNEKLWLRAITGEYWCECGHTASSVGKQICLNTEELQYTGVLRCSRAQWVVFFCDAAHTVENVAFPTSINT